MVVAGLRAAAMDGRDSSRGIVPCARNLAPAARAAYLLRVRVLPLLLLVAVAGCKKTDGISRDLGAACQANSDCTDRCLPEPRWPDGFCSLDCRSTDDCPVGSDCLST